MTPPKQVLQLIEHFERNLDEYKRSAYKETQVRGEHDKDVIHLVCLNHAFALS